MLDYVLMSPNAVPLVKDLTVVRAVAWKPHVGLVLSLRASGQTLRTRELTLPSKLPQLPRPRREPTPGSKSSQAKVITTAKRLEAHERRVVGFQEAFGDVLEPVEPPGTNMFQEADEADLDPDFFGAPEDEEDPWAHELHFLADSHLSSNEASVGVGAGGVLAAAKEKT